MAEITPATNAFDASKVTFFTDTKMYTPLYLNEISAENTGNLGFIVLL